MDLLATVRKEGSRGGQGDFSWSDVQNSSRREHYLGHSLMAPVGRWSKGRDLSWYAKADGKDADGEDTAERAARERKEEIKRVKQAEEDALARALGLPVPVRDNANMEPVSDKREVDKVLKEVTGTDEDTGPGLGFGSKDTAGVTSETIEGDVMVIENNLPVKGIMKDITDPTGIIIDRGVIGPEIDLVKDERNDLVTVIKDVGLGLGPGLGPEAQNGGTIEEVGTVQGRLVDQLLAWVLPKIVLFLNAGTSLSNIPRNIVISFKIQGTKPGLRFEVTPKMPMTGPVKAISTVSLIRVKHVE